VVGGPKLIDQLLGDVGRTRDLGQRSFVGLVGFLKRQVAVIPPLGLGSDPTGRGDVGDVAEYPL
jgi:hypothetical protein